MMILQLSEPDSVLGQQAYKYFETLGVKVNPKEIKDVIDMVSGSIETAVKADKGGYSEPKAHALGMKRDALMRMQGLRNKIFAEAVTKLGAQQKQVAEGQAQTIQRNAGMPILSGSPEGQQQGASSSLDLIKSLVQKANT